MKEEQMHFSECRKVIADNIAEYEKKVEEGKKETEALHAAVASGDVELYNQLIVSKDMLAHSENILRKNHAAYTKPYFGRVDYTETGNAKMQRLYIGKNGVSKNRTEVLIVDWRAPVSTLYYENELGRGCYAVPDEGEIEVELKKKRTFDVADGKLIGYYDNDTAATDELLVKYLSQNKDVVLGDIISTIQKEQNEIIRESPYFDIIVQGVAGSGKTTVAMHRISYILYNYADKFLPGEFCIIGGNDMLLAYITSGLPELDVHDVKQKCMDRFFLDLLEKGNKKLFPKIFGKGKTSLAKKADREGDAAKSSIEFMLALEEYLAEKKARSVPAEDVVDKDAGLILPAESIRDTLRENTEFSIVQLQKLLNERLQKRIAFLMTEEERENRKKEIRARYRGYFKMEKQESDILRIYEDFLMRYYAKTPGEGSTETGVPKAAEAANQAAKGLPRPGEFGVYDLAALVLIDKRVTAKAFVEDYTQIIVDEAQDFGAGVYYVLKNVLYGCHFTIMGDVSQNIHYETGMNHWEVLKEQVFDPKRLHFYILAKSYRNTIEISECAGKILEKASFGAYKITPVIRHGRKVGFYGAGGDVSAVAKKVKELVSEITGRGFATVSVICRDEAEAEKVRGLLKMEVTQERNFEKGLMVLPIALTKGLEFDAVILWNPSPEAYGANEAEAKLLYVAVTRALHELHIVYRDEVSALFA